MEGASYLARKLKHQRLNTSVYGIRKLHCGRQYVLQDLGGLHAVNTS